jgi:hypothetical protein
VDKICFIACYFCCCYIFISLCHFYTTKNLSSVLIMLILYCKYLSLSTDICYWYPLILYQYELTITK